MSAIIAFITFALCTVITAGLLANATMTRSGIMFGATLIALIVSTIVLHNMVNPWGILLYAVIVFGVWSTFRNEGGDSGY